ncbi:MAG TPA: MIP/aquaporin family protein [Gracilimonas sp.]|uniref:MIP/aquaporin family protein n=1 Tax=Gracilimonas sp. TaxID=1974203 RepID=UPI002DAA55D6|nr:MIP/aquaporin family protein [Gracilimonas sp.]
MNPLLAEFIGTSILLLFGCGVVANVILNKTKGNSSGWIVITWGWGMGVFIAVYTMGQFSGAHINPAVTIGLATAGLFEWSMVIPYILSQIAGGFFGGLLTWLAYKDHFEATEDGTTKLAVFSTIPEIRNYGANFITEAIATFILIFGILYLSSPGFIDMNGELLSAITISGKEVGFGLGALAALPVALLVFGIGLALGGPTGYAINSARDLGPRIAHAVLPFSNKGSSDWAYSWIPIVAPSVGAVLAALAFRLL